MKKKVIRFSLILPVIVLLLATALLCLSRCKRETDEGTEETQTSLIRSAEMMGIGGYGAIFDANIDPFNKNYFAFASDMGGVYFSYDTGKRFSRHNIMGRIFNIEYDKSTEGAVWMCGSGVFKSEDHGRTVKMVFPQESDLQSTGRNYENGNYWLYDKFENGDPRKYPYSLQMKGLAVNEASNGQNVFVSVVDKWERNKILIYETKNGNNFSLCTELERNGADNCELYYREQNQTLLLLISYPDKTEIVELDEAKAAKTIYSTGETIKGFDKYYNRRTNSNTFVFTQTREKNSLQTDSAYDKYVKTDIFKVSDFSDKSGWENLSLALTDGDAGLKNSHRYGTASEHYFDWDLSYLDIVDENNVYLFQKTKVNVDSRLLNVFGYIRYASGQYTWLFGHPFKPYSEIENGSWQDSDQPTCYGICGTEQDPDFLLFGTVVGLYYSENDGGKIIQCNSNLHEEITLQTKNSLGETEERKFKRYSTTGIDVQTTYEVITDPFNPDHVVITCTDIGLVHSFDNGKTWIRNASEISPDYRNTCYYLEFDQYRKGVVYSVWCGKHDAPYSPDSSYLNCVGMFGISYDAGVTWEFTSIVGNNKILPYRMFVDYEGSERTIYLASLGRGFFVSRDSGKSFTEMNEGISTKDFGVEQVIFANDILKCSEGIFAFVSGYAPDLDSALYHYNESSARFEEIPLPEGMGCIRDIEYSEKDRCLYLAVVGNRYVRGGVMSYKNGAFSYLTDEKFSAFGVDLDPQGRLYVTSLESKIYRFSLDLSEYEALEISLHHMLKNVSFGKGGKVLYVTSLGGGVCKVTLN